MENEDEGWNPPLVKHACGEQRPNAMLAIRRSAGVTPEVNFGEHTSCTPLPSVNKADFETQRRRHQKSKTGVSVGPLKGMCLPNIKKIYKSQRNNP